MKKMIAPVLALTLLLCCVASAEETTYDFSEQAETYLTYIGTNLTNRNVVAEGEEEDPTSTHEETIEWILSELKNAGYADEQIVHETEMSSSYDEKKYPVTNIVLTVEGQDTSKQIIVAAHYDGDGVGDNGSGTALLLSTACGLAGETPLYTVKYIFLDGEEVGLVGAENYVNAMSEEEIASTVFMVNIDSVAFGDYCNIYGGVADENGNVTQTEAYDLAVTTARSLGINVYTTEDLDGYYAANGEGPAIETNALYTNPWTSANPAPANAGNVSPTTGDWSDHAAFKYAGIPYLYLEATNWFAAGDGGEDAYTGYFEVSDASVGYDGMFMNTEYDTLENLTTLYPGRSLEHFRVFSPLLCKLIMQPVAA